MACVAETDPLLSCALPYSALSYPKTLIPHLDTTPHPHTTWSTPIHISGAHLPIYKYNLPIRYI